MTIQTHPEVSLTFRKTDDGGIKINCDGRKSKDQELSRRAQVLAQLLKHMMPILMTSVEQTIAEYDAEKQTAAQEIH
ncbi:hypothetical protein [Thalassolituus oleivorans]|uniref:Uncharacterized protein n=1 Tax=Thalassolituus oleivorans MIL-1 TaxID=1298593 RepID=M5DN91_9GAMM|nr:hypothetical protein [Thalassolituus oleivorans]CCU70901.1 hypothetical protein TOL_0462 [Thalassolituus oleivorans MIL-1]